MNNGKICVSVCVKTADEFIEKIKQAAEIADIIELRFDCLKKSEIERFWKINRVHEIFDGKLITTFRPKKQGGKRVLNVSERKEFWNKWAVDEFADWADFEYDFLEDNWHFYFRATLKKIIWSFHHFTETPHYLDSMYEKLSEIIDYEHPRKDCDSVKIAVQANEITDSLAIWKLLEKAKSENKQLIPIAMGEAGKWTRILGLAFGSPITYASLESGGETAPGQISAKDLIEVYRVKELNKQTEIYGVVGNPVSHSLSPYMHNMAFKHHKLNAVYIPFEVKTFDEFFKRMANPFTREIDWNLRGFSVTIPHKETVMKHLTDIDDAAEQIGAVNTVYWVEDDDAIYGKNTDAEGFIQPLYNLYGTLIGANVGVFGCGGAARAVCYSLMKAKAKVTVFARNLEKADSLAKDFGVTVENLSTNRDYDEFDILVNATPLGMTGELENQTPASASQLKNVGLVYDLVYNPFETLFMREAKSVGVPTIGGLAMLVAQGMKQFEIWTGLEAPMKEMSRAALQRLK